VANDFDHDGDLDLFVGGRIQPTRYPEAPESYVLVNDGKGKFQNRASAFNPELNKVGMVSSALWTDINNDGWTDLAVVGEWMPITFFVNEGGKSFSKLSIPESSGWWNSIAGGDFDNDGDTDYIAGNLGLNSIYKASVNEPVTICAKDFDSNGSVDPIICRYVQGKEYPAPPRDALTGQIASLKAVIDRYSLYGGMELKDFLSEEKREGALILKSTLFASVYIENTGNNTFSVRPLPTAAQFSPLYGIAVQDINGDGNLDVLSVGNSYASEPLSGFYDAGIGNYLEGDGKGNFKNVPVTMSGFFVDGDAKGLATLTLNNGGQLFIATQNRDSVRVFRHAGVPVPQMKGVAKRRPLDDYVLVELGDGRKRKEEIYRGSGYLSSSSGSVVPAGGMKQVNVIIGSEKKKQAIP
jgi:hypothetical protein